MDVVSSYVSKDITDLKNVFISPNKSSSPRHSPTLLWFWPSILEAFLSFLMILFCAHCFGLWASLLHDLAAIGLVTSLDLLSWVCQISRKGSSHLLTARTLGATKGKTFKPFPLFSFWYPYFQLLSISIGQLPSLLFFPDIKPPLFYWVGARTVTQVYKKRVWGSDCFLSWLSYSFYPPFTSRSI